jgi:hypothetical protein
LSAPGLGAERDRGRCHSHASRIGSPPRSRVLLGTRLRMRAEARFRPCSSPHGHQQRRVYSPPRDEFARGFPSQQKMLSVVLAQHHGQCAHKGRPVGAPSGLQRKSPAFGAGLEVDGVRHLKSPASPARLTHSAALGSDGDEKSPWSASQNCLARVRRPDPRHRNSKLTMKNENPARKGLRAGSRERSSLGARKDRTLR